MGGREKSSRSRRIYSAAPRDEKNRQVCLMAFQGKGPKKLNIAFAPLEKL
jgi:hypothetical protein